MRRPICQPSWDVHNFEHHLYTWLCGLREVVPKDQNLSGVLGTQLRLVLSEQESE
jgi:hypothetical protein